MRRTVTPERVLATVVFTDIVGSTELAGSLGDRRWRELLARHHAAVRSELKRFRGREIDTAGDGFFAVFDRPAAAIECALAIVAALRPLGVDIRVGVHTGEVEQSGPRVGGIAVHIGARVMATAAAGEIVVTSTVKDLVAGSTIQFADRGVASLKGVDGEWHLYGVVIPAAQPAEPATAVPGEPTNAQRTRSPAILAMVGIAALALAVASLVLPRALAGPPVPGADTVGRVPSGGSAFDLVVKVGKAPNGVAAGGGYVWVVNGADQTMSQVDPAAGVTVANPAVGGTPGGIAFGDSGLWVTTRFGLAAGDTGSVVPFDTRAVRSRSIPVSSGVEAVAFGAGWVWVADRIHDVVRKIDPAAERLAPDEIPAGRSPGSVAVAAGSLWATSTLDDTVWRIDAATGERIETIALQTTPTAIAGDDSAVWVTSDAGDRITRIDPSTNRVVTTVPGLDGPNALAIGPTGVWIAVAREQRMARIDGATNAIVETVGVGGVPSAVAVDDRGAVWVTVRRP